LIVGLWCPHGDHHWRGAIRRVFRPQCRLAIVRTLLHSSTQSESLALIRSKPPWPSRTGNPRLRRIACASEKERRAHSALEGRALAPDPCPPGALPAGGGAGRCLLRRVDELAVAAALADHLGGTGRTLPCSEAPLANADGAQSAVSRKRFRSLHRTGPAPHGRGVAPAAVRLSRGCRRSA
jgi:hypothetical protein